MVGTTRTTERNDEDDGSRMQRREKSLRDGAHFGSAEPAGESHEISACRSQQIVFSACERGCTFGLGNESDHR